MKILLGIDYGTGGCKVTALGADGSFAGEASTEYVTYHEHPGWSEQEPADWWTSLCSSLRKLAAKGVNLQDVVACALDGSTHNAVLMDGAFKPVRRTIMWTDQRATAECDALRAGWGEKVFSTCYQMPAPTWTLPQMMWLKANEPEVLAKTEHVLFVKDYVRYLLTGNAATDRIEAQGTLFFDMKKGDWADELVELAGLKRSALPGFIAPTDVAGHVTASAAAATGRPSCCSVTAMPTRRRWARCRFTTAASYCCGVSSPTARLQSATAVAVWGKYSRSGTGQAASPGSAITRRGSPAPGQASASRGHSISHPSCRKRKKSTISGTASPHRAVAHRERPFCSSSPLGERPSRPSKTPQSSYRRPIPQHRAADSIIVASSGSPGKSRSRRSS